MSRGGGLLLGLLLLVNAFAFVDRTIIAIVAQPMKQDLGLSDTQIGLLGGLSFALFYGLLSLPLARLAERRDRITLISVCLALWSVATALCGLAQNFVQLLLARLTVGIGEAGSGAPSQALISDRFPPERRASALSIFALGTPVGIVLGAIGGGWLASQWGWRGALIGVGLPGVLLAVVVRITLRDPRPASPTTLSSSSAPSLRDVALTFLSVPALGLVTLAGACSSFTAYGLSQFLPAHFARSYDATPLQAGLAVAFIAAIGSGAGTALGGYAAQALGGWRPALFLAAPGLALALAAPFYALGLAQPDLTTSAVVLLLPHALQFVWLGAGLAAIQNLAPPLGRATAAAIAFLVFNLVGLGLGPLFVGALSDMFASAAAGGEPGRALRWAMMSATTASVLGGALLVVAGLRYPRDLAGRQAV